jgi:RNA polymerase sigma factor (sigma-70 family)
VKNHLKNTKPGAETSADSRLDQGRDKMPGSESTNRTLEEYRKYLETLTYIKVAPRMFRAFAWADIVSQTLWEAHQGCDQIREMNEDGKKRYLRRMFINNLVDEIRKDPPIPIVSLAEADRDSASSHRLQSYIASAEPSPSEQHANTEAARRQRRRLREALARLPDRQRQALILQRYHGLKLKEIAEYMGCTINAVAGLHANGLKNLRKLLSESE